MITYRMDVSGGSILQKQLKIGVFTPRSINPLHPRLLFFRQYFLSRGFAVEFIGEPATHESVLSRVNWLCLWYFDILAILRCRRKLHGYDIVMVNDLKYLPLVKYAKRLGKMVIYDTIDHNVHLRFYQLVQKIPAVRHFKKRLDRHFAAREKYYAFSYCDFILVNSVSLHEYFERKSYLIYYSSPFERLNVINDPTKPPAFLYLGAFTSEKGAHEILQLQRRLKRPLYIYGPVSDQKMADEIASQQNVFYSPKISVAELEQRIKELFNRHFLFGFSIIKPAHYSYEVQEANKDIDYLSLGIPLIGNDRLPTRNKIEAGCGIYVNDDAIERKISDEGLRAGMAQQAKLYYRQVYHSEHAIQVLDKIVLQLKR